MRSTRFILVVLGTLLTASALSGAIIQFTDRTAFEAAAGTVTNQDFESFAPNPNAFDTVPFDFIGFSILNVNSDGEGRILSSTQSLINNTQEVSGVTRVGGAEFVFLFDLPTRAIGFEMWDLSDENRQNNFVFNNAVGDVVPISHPDPTPAGFLGFISDSSFTTLTIRQVGMTPVDAFRIDDVVYAPATTGATVPEPFTFALFCTGLLGLCSRRKLFSDSGRAE